MAFLLLFTLKDFWLFIPIGIFLVLQFLHLRKRFRQTFEPIKIFQIKVDDLIKFTNKSITKEELIDSFSKLADNKKIKNSLEESVHPNVDESVDDNQNEKIVEEMEHFLMINEFASAFNGRVREIFNSRSYLKNFLWKALFSLFLAMVFFGAINFALYNYDSTQFKTDYIPNYFHFFYYSFFTIIPDGIDIVPLGTLAKIIRMLGVIVGVLINFLILAVYFSVSNDKYKENLEKIIGVTEQFSKNSSNLYHEKYGHSTVDGINKLKERGSKIESQIKLLTKYINP